MVASKAHSDLNNKCEGTESLHHRKVGLTKKFKTSGVKTDTEPLQESKNKSQEEIAILSLYEQIKELCSLKKITDILYRPCPASSLAVARILFGLMMVIDIPDERGLFEIDIRYGNPMKCHFPLFNWMTPLPLEYMGILYFIMWIVGPSFVACFKKWFFEAKYNQKFSNAKCLRSYFILFYCITSISTITGAAGICLGYGYQIACIMFAVPYWYIFLLDKTTWNNHSYLYGLLSILFTFCSANHAFSVDSKLHRSLRNQPVPLWNYAILRFQFFLLYFYAGVKKFDLDWIGGHSMTRLSKHWVFDPFRLLLTDEQIDIWIIHIFGFVFDLTVGFFLLISKTRPIAILFSSAFHLMNSRLFHIGQFPYVCLCMTPIFCSYDWPERLCHFMKNVWTRSFCVFENAEYKKLQGKSFFTNCRRKLTVYLLAFYVALQLFLPFSHFITKGYNNWTNGLYGYSWDMMVHNWDSVLTVIKVVDNDSGEEFFIDPEAWVVNSRYTQHGDMLIQYANCLKRNLPNLPGIKSNAKPKFQNISVYIDVWCSLNGRFQQRMFDPRQDLLKAKWNPFESITWLMPLISDLTPWREKMSDLEKEIVERANDSGVLFVADFPDLYLNNYIVPDLSNVTLTVLQGSVTLEKQGQNGNKNALENKTLHEGESDGINSGEFHKVYTISPMPSCYMYSYVNETLKNVTGGDHPPGTLREYDTLAGSLKFRLENLIDSILILRSCFNKFLYDIPIQIRMN